MTIANLKKEIRARIAIANLAKIANGSRMFHSSLAELAPLAVAPPSESALNIGSQTLVGIEEQSNLEIVTCNACERFSPDKIGDGAGIGSCELGVKWTQEFNGRMPLFRYSERHCKQFSKLMD